MIDWQPISTAPKAGLKRILVWRNGAAEIAHWAVMVEEDGKTLSGGWWWTDRLIRDADPQPTHWASIDNFPLNPIRDRADD